MVIIQSPEDRFCGWIEIQCSRILVPQRQELLCFSGGNRNGKDSASVTGNANEHRFAVSCPPQDLIARGITSPKHLGIMGHSGGGLLVGAVVVQRPSLFNAVVCLNPVLDMKRFLTTKDEYGDPDNPDDWNCMKAYSPYHNVSPDSTYPQILFVTSRTDQRVPPWHARKMAAKMEDMGHQVLFYEREEGGHESAASPRRKAYRDAMIYSYLLKQLR